MGDRGWQVWMTGRRWVAGLLLRRLCMHGMAGLLMRRPALQGTKGLLIRRLGMPGMAGFLKSLKCWAWQASSPGGLSTSTNWAHLQEACCTKPKARPPPQEACPLKRSCTGTYGTPADHGQINWTAWYARHWRPPPEEAMGARHGMPPPEEAMCDRHGRPPPEEAIGARHGNPPREEAYPLKQSGLLHRRPATPNTNPIPQSK